MKTEIHCTTTVVVPHYYIESNYYGEKLKGEFKLYGIATNDIKRSFDKSFYLELPFSLPFHNSHNSPELCANWLKEKIALTNSWHQVNELRCMAHAAERGNRQIFKALTLVVTNYCHCII